MSASEAQREVVFFPYDDQDFEDPCRGVSDLLQRVNATVGDLMRALEKFYECIQKEEYKNLKLFDYLHASFGELEPTQQSSLT